MPHTQNLISLGDLRTGMRLLKTTDSLPLVSHPHKTLVGEDLGVVEGTGPKLLAAELPALSPISTSKTSLLSRLSTIKQHLLAGVVRLLVGGVLVEVLPGTPEGHRSVVVVEALLLEGEPTSAAVVEVGGIGKRYVFHHRRPSSFNHLYFVQNTRTRESSVVISPQWSMLEEIEFHRLSKLRLEVDEPEDL